MLSLNVRGLSNYKKRKQIFTWCKKQKAEIVLLQETHSTKQEENRWSKEWGGEICFSHGETNARGTAILFKNGVDLTVKEKYLSSDGRFIGLKAKINDMEYIIFNIYAPNSNTSLVKFYKEFSNFLTEKDLNENHNFIIGGDFNCPLNPLIDKRGGNLEPKKDVVNLIEQVMIDLDLQDIWRIKNPNTRSYTWCQKKTLIFCRLDYWLISKIIHDNVKETEILPSIRTDHSAITIELKRFDDSTRGPNYWKLNNLLLNEPDYVKHIKDGLNDHWIKESLEFPNKRAGWDWIKYKIRESSIKYSKERAFRKKNFEQKAQLQLNLKKNDFEINPTPETEKDFFLAKQNIEKIYQEKTEGILTRTRLQWYEFGEKSNKYFFGLEKRNYIKKHMKSMNVNGKVITDPKEIRDAQRNFYATLYSEINVDLSGEKATEFLNIPLENKLDESLRNSCEGILTFKEITDVLSTFTNNKSPGNDGLSIEFYKTFWNEIGLLLLNCFNEAYINGEMSHSQKQAVITLIEKKNKDRKFIENWRPLSLSNVDSKIATKAIAQRIKSVLPNIIHHNQSGFMKNRFIGETIRSILDIMEYTSQEKIPGILLFVDFEKAFDTVSRQYIIKSLESFNFGPSIIQWVKTFYKNTISCVMNNGFSSGYFDIKRGVRQGDPLSPYIFLLAVEILGHAVRSDKSIRGVKILEEETKILQYADDTTNCLSDKESLQRLLTLFNKFENISGLKINYTKTEAMWIGSKINSDETPFGLKWAKKYVKALGICFTYDKMISIKHNFEDKLSNMQKLVDCWRTRNLTIFGKILIIKSLIISKLIYVASVLSVPLNVIKQVEKIIFKFLWKGPDKVTRKSTFNEYEKGGIKMVDIKTQIKALKLTWIRRTFDPQYKSVWKKYLEYILKPKGGLFFLFCNYNTKEFPFCSSFYTELFSYWEEFKLLFLKEDLGEYIIWNNKNILVNGKSIFYKHLYDKDIVFISDLFLDKTCRESINIYKEKGVDIRNYIKWLGLRSIIPKKIITPTFNRENAYEFLRGEMEFKLDDKSFTITKAECKMFYQFLITNITTYPKKAAKLKEEYNLSESDLKQTYSIPRKVTSENYIIQFQYKVLNDILYDNSMLKKFGILKTDLCTFCKKQKDSIEHMLFSCEKIQLFWENVSQVIKIINKKEIDLDKKSVFVGILYQCDNFLLINFIILLAKSYIYTCKRNSQIPTLICFIEIVKSKYELEKQIVINKTEKKQKIFKKKWNGFICNYVR